MRYEAGEKWDRMVEAHPGRFVAEDAEVLALYCETWRDWWKAKKHADEETTPGKWWSAAQVARRQLESLLCRMGLTPADAARVPVAALVEEEGGQAEDGLLD